MEPVCLHKFGVDAGEDWLRLVTGAFHSGGRGEIGEDIAHQDERGFRATEVEDILEGTTQAGPSLREPEGMDVSLDEVLIGQVKARRRDLAGDHQFGPLEKVLVVRAAGGAVGKDDGGLTAAAGASAALGVIGWRRRHIAHIDHIELVDVHAQFHGRRAIEDRQPGGLETLLAFLPQFIGDLCGMFPRFKAGGPGGGLAVVVEKIGIGAAACGGKMGDTDGIVKGPAAVPRVPDHGRGGKLVARAGGIAGVDRDHQTGLGQEGEEITDELLGFIHVQLPFKAAEGVGTAEVDAEAAAAGEINLAPGFGAAAGAWKEQGGPLHFFVFIERPGSDQILVVLLLDALLKPGIEIVHLDGKLAAHIIEQHLHHPAALVHRGGGEDGMPLLPEVVGL